MPLMWSTDGSPGTQWRLPCRQIFNYKNSTQGIDIGSDGFVSAMAIYDADLSGSCIYNTLLDARSAVLVFPHHLAPSINTAPDECNNCCNKLSLSLGRYLFVAIRICIEKSKVVNILTLYKHISGFGAVLLPNLALFYFRFWHCFTSDFGKMIPLANSCLR